MLKIKRLFGLLLFVSTAFTALAQIDAGMYNTRYIYGTYTIDHHYRVGANHSIFSEKFGFQQVGVSAGYTDSFRNFDYDITAYGATAWNGDYHIVGGIIGLQYSPVKILHIQGQFNPLYDSGYKYKTCFSLRAAVDLSRSIAISARYTTIPDYRKSEKRLHGSFRFHVGPLSVEPTLSLPIAGEQKFKNLRVLTSINYHFSL